MAVASGKGSLTLSPPTGTTIATLTLGQSMSVTVSATGGAAPYAYWQCNVDVNYDGDAICLPAGLSLDPDTGVLSGTPTTPGTYTFEVSAVENFAGTGVASYTVVVNGGTTPTLTQVTPPTGSTAGGTTVTLTGTNLTGATAVSFGGSAASSFTVNNATTITATTPAHAAGAVNVVATTSNGTATLTNGYTYALPAPTAGAVSTTVAANSSANPITLSLGGGAATSVAVASAASHGTATASGTSITYTPTAGYSGADSFTYTATNASGTSSPATVSITVSAPTLVLSPASGALAGGSTGSAYSTTISTSGGTAPYSYAITAGSLPIGLSLNTSTGALSGTPGSSGTSNFTVTATDANSATGSNAYSITVSGLPPTASAVSATVAANSSANPITLSLGGGAATSVAVASAASHGTATASGTSITYTPTAGYSGADSFTYTATNASGTSSPATVSITVSAPTLVLSPASGALAGGSTGSAYSTTISTSGGTAPYSYAITAGSLPIGLSLNTSTGVISGTPSGSGSSNFTVTATDANSATGSNAYSIAISGLPPTASAVSATVAANSSANPITLSLGGGAATSVAIASAASNGTATASGTSITYTPTPGYSGTDSFTYTATNASGTSTPATVSITVSAPTLNLTPVSLGNGTVGVAYSAAVSASGGTAPYSYTITAGSLPVGLSLNTSTGALSGTPSTNGTSNLTITVTDSHSATGSRAYTLTIGAQVPTASAVSATVAANSSANPITLSLGGGAATSVAVASAASHGTATASGTSITYTPTAGYSGADSFTYTATNASGTSSPATVSITVTAQPASVASSARTLRAGEAVTVDLTDGATGGPFTSAQLVSLTPASAGQAVIIDENGAVVSAFGFGAPPPPRYSMRFIPAAAFTGSAVAAFSLSNGASTASGTVTFTVQSRPDPSKDAEVIGLVNAQNRAAERFASTQMANFNRRLEQLHQNTCHANAFGIKLGAGGATIPVADLATVAANALSGKAQDGTVANGSKRPATAVPVPAGDGRPAAAVPAAPSAAAGDCSSEPLAFWTDGFVNFGSNDTRHGRGTDFTTVGLSGGLDYRVSSALTLGVGLGYGNDRSLIGSDDTRSDADAISAAVYASFHPMPQVFIDGVLGYSWISFDSRRYVTADPSSGYARGSRDASQVFGSLTGSYEYRQGNLLLAPYGRLNAAITRFDAFSESGGGMYALHYGDQTQRYVTSFLGLRSSYDLPTSWGMVTPSLRIEWGHNFSNSGGVDLSYADLVGGPVYRLNTDPLSSNFVNVDLGADISLSKLWLLGIGYKTSLGASGEQNQLFRIGLTSRF
ncbi:putative Ig domain-containing protein [Microvirgula aerodenitrificans]|uniref:putative Ig domain-containing protein n=1 Tax=Microvirgula aerodenitrificans TaxID=57480 RepID=UPI00248D891F|nr:putative Ig domain-containing protein [Microvirgula aerodenitrificans]